MIEVSPYTFITIILALCASHFVASLLGFLLCYGGCRVYNQSAKRVMNNLAEYIQTSSINSIPPLPPHHPQDPHFMMETETINDDFEAFLEAEQQKANDPAALAQRLARTEEQA